MSNLPNIAFYTNLLYPKNSMFDTIKHIHIVGAGGIGVSALVKLWLKEGKHVTGSDVNASEITEDLVNRGLKFWEGQAPHHVSVETEVVVYSPAVPFDDQERVRAREVGAKECSYPEALGILTKSYSTIVVTGTNGKSSTTAMLGLVLEAAGYDPTVIVGSLVPGWKDGNLRVGKGRFLVVEGCEHKAHILKLYPEMIVLTNIEADHLDFYRDIDHIRETFQKFVDQLKGKGMVVWNANDIQSNRLRLGTQVSYGLEINADYLATGRTTHAGNQSANVSRSTPPEELGGLSLQVPGTFNLMNALAATSAAMELGVPFETCQRTLKAYAGIWRRFERVGSWKGVEVISDYGHHPTAVAGTIDAAREFFPGHHIVLCFQPHQHSRTEKLFDDFVTSIAKADTVVLPEIYRVEGRTENEAVSSQLLVDAIKKMSPKKPIYFAKDLNEAKEILEKIVKKDSILLIQGAGEVDRIAREIIKGQ